MSDQHPVTSPSPSPESIESKRLEIALRALEVADQGGAERVQLVDEKVLRRERVKTPMIDKGMPLVRFVPAATVATDTFDGGGAPVEDEVGASFVKKGLTVAALILAVGFVIGIYRTSAIPAVSGAGGRVIAVPLTEAEESFGEHLVQFERDAIETAELFLVADDWRDVASYVRRGKQISSDLSDYQRTNPKRPTVVKKFESLKATFDERGNLLHMLEFEDSEFRKGRLYFADGPTPEVLWEVFVAHCEIPFEDFASRETVGTGVFRVFAELDDYRPEPFEDEAKWSCLRLSYPDCDQIVYGYALREAAQGVAVAEMLSGEQPVAMVVRLTSVGARGICCAEIEEVIGRGWHSLAQSEVPGAQSGGG